MLQQAAQMLDAAMVVTFTLIVICSWAGLAKSAGNGGHESRKGAEVFDDHALHTLVQGSFSTHITFLREV